ncbi:MAG: shikimate kinase [Butyrivibrio sp.]|nr:shikimate kinase [Butyrivibrio sp.]
MNNLILIGFMGSGKSSLGRYISGKGYRLVDTDGYIEDKLGRAVSDIFGVEGEEYFRELETKTLEELLEEGAGDCVIAVGGGLPLRERNRELMHRLGTVIYLRAKPSTLEFRLSGDKRRPLLQEGKLRERIDGLMSERKDIYEAAADIIIDTDGFTFEEIYGQLKERIL